jgi:hypothetical protein
MSRYVFLIDVTLRNDSQLLPMDRLSIHLIYGSVTMQLVFLAASMMPLPGDTRIYAEHSTLLTSEEFVWGDSAYPISSWVVVPYKV